MSKQNAFARDKWSVKAKFHYAILVADRSEADGNLQRAGIRVGAKSGFWEF